jgi:putative ATPase
LFTFIGATTENPSFEVNSALLSRAAVHVLQPLDEPTWPAARARPGDAGRVPPWSRRRAPSAWWPMPMAMRAGCSTPWRPWPSRPAQGAAGARRRLLKRAGRTLRRYDKGGEQFYDTISALHKSVRGSDPDAALYWLVRMLDGGATRATRRGAAAHGQRGHRPGRPARPAAGAGRGRGLRAPGQPEGELALAEAWSTWPWRPSQRRLQGLQRVRAFVRRDGTRPVPLHLRNAPTRLMKDLDYGRDYRYAHDEADGFAAGERYLPDGLTPSRPSTEPVPRGLEIRIGERLRELRARNISGLIKPPMLTRAGAWVRAG